MKKRKKIKIRKKGRETDFGSFSNSWHYNYVYCLVEKQTITTVFAMWFSTILLERKEKKKNFDYYAYSLTLGLLIAQPASPPTWAFEVSFLQYYHHPTFCKKEKKVSLFFFASQWLCRVCMCTHVKISEKILRKITYLMVKDLLW